MIFLYFLLKEAIEAYECATQVVGTSWEDAVWICTTLVNM